MTIYFKNLKLKTHPDVYEPADDSMLLADNL
ncbi:MAG TPA: protoporphyrinogen oxidase, partial [Candidatus Altiarchaeales archaeon]|nr:protoporphyrinogen oxidase [Candidatus Altiarchaeales archaeon]